MKVTTYETLYHEHHGAIWKHKCGKRDSSIVPSEEKDDGDYDSPTSRDETPDEKKRKEAIKKRPK